MKFSTDSISFVINFRLIGLNYKICEQKAEAVNPAANAALRCSLDCQNIHWRRNTIQNHHWQHLVLKGTVHQTRRKSMNKLQVQSEGKDSTLLSEKVNGGSHQNELDGP